MTNSEHTNNEYLLDIVLNRVKFTTTRFENAKQTVNLSQQWKEIINNDVFVFRLRIGVLSKTE